MNAAIRDRHGRLIGWVSADGQLPAGPLPPAVVPPERHERAWEDRRAREGRVGKQ